MSGNAEYVYAHGIHYTTTQRYFENFIVCWRHWRKKKHNELLGGVTLWLQTAAAPGRYHSLRIPLSPVFCASPSVFLERILQELLGSSHVAGDIWTPVVSWDFTFLAVLPGRWLLGAMLFRTRRDKSFRASGQGAPTGCVFTRCRTLSGSLPVASLGRGGLLSGWALRGRPA